MKKTIRMILSLVLVLVLGATAFTACGSKHEHGFSEEWTHDETGHWHACTGENCEEKGEFAAHVYDNDADTTCNVCGYERAVVPTVKTYTITFVTNGGSPVAQIEAEAGDEITVPAAPTKSGERFVVGTKAPTAARLSNLTRSYSAICRAKTSPFMQSGKMR